MTIDSADLLARFLRYVQIDTRSDAHSATTPTTPGQWDLLRLLTAELTALGATEVTLTAHGYVLATIPATVTQPVPVTICVAGQVLWIIYDDVVDGCAGMG